MNEIDDGGRAILRTVAVAAVAIAAALFSLTPLATYLGRHLARQGLADPSQLRRAPVR